VLAVQPKNVVTHSVEVTNINTEDSMQDSCARLHSYVLLLVSKSAANGVSSA
jgi:hypothetical protein